MNLMMSSPVNHRLVGCIFGTFSKYLEQMVDEESNRQTIDTLDGLEIRRTSGGFLSSTASSRISDGVVVFLLCSLELQKKHHHF